MLFVFWVERLPSKLNEINPCFEKLCFKPIFPTKVISFFNSLLGLKVAFVPLISYFCFCSVINLLKSPIQPTDRLVFPLIEYCIHRSKKRLNLQYVFYPK